MKVECRRVENPVSGLDESSSGWLRVWLEYVVLEVYAYPDRRTDLRLISDDAETPALFDSALFTTVEDSIPSSWVGQIAEGGVFRLGPKDWMERGFWEAFFGRDPTAVRKYYEGQPTLRSD